MNSDKWYPAAALSAILLGCGPSTDAGSGTPGTTGGGTSIDGGTPIAIGGQATAYYGVLLAGGTSAGLGGASSIGGAGTGGIDVPHSMAGGIGTGGFHGLGGGVTLYGPRFDKPAVTSISSGGARAREDANAEGGALHGSENPQFYQQHRL